ncbi:TPA: L-2-amino-thiazoline-4-carboxylic acid hydrolase [Pseudomonas aeruginosa]|uniref:L-2-amino-thiazoline-4-carboxylic acid hydrolase n=1 Tax=Pseudomonas aeruginosa TaxID=287 RepID=UPI0019049BC7|nr:L-2-amino-thiazoline-4-carboxylic acid hydrolase [Pseudomonas aeruginosa]MCO3228168.1 2-amino-thiazoline-4-carboxylic acid hydrolase [Pseudomonas aeruginosa]MDI2463334.1 L-2-amino-thiazoline-4-carboxylic acid hydrolase [Pseudomonas aeruginosa]QQM06888.1 L-2-amino-thiazoline-4-carboxylic acid hydrolase [Pseudomonas aeruginosa]HBO4310939.1 L-2-amino-thiazoline-4-carboxylic acid hydrolase [Pseudomonas aeruginosa]HBO4703957.1 L-2-amino-thiazoline-4-carboxylic acid hydrolase [Pseudomonas aerugin
MSDKPVDQSGAAIEGEIGILARRRIEAGVIAPIYEEMRARLGEEVAQSIIDTAIRKAAVEAGRSFAAKTPGGTNLRTFQELQKLWTQDDALIISVGKATDDEFHYTVHRCRYAEMYREMGLGHIGHLLSCNRDYMFPQGYDSNIELERTQTLMEGASCCDFKYRYAKERDGQK